jgi:hypothetical protein
VRTLTKILEKLGEHMAYVGWMYGAPVYWRRPYHSHLRREDR